MARTITEIFDAIEAARVADVRLADLNSPSDTAIHRLWAYVVATAHNVLETIFDRHKFDVDTALARAKPGTSAWYAGRALLFQLGDTLLVDDEGIHYPAGSTGQLIITRAAAVEDNLSGKLTIKVAKAAAAPGQLDALSAAELVQVRAYFDRVGFAGVRKEVVSRAADKLKVVANIYYDALVNVPLLQAASEAAVQAYLATLSDTDFDGLVYLSKIEDALQAVPGVRDVQLVEVSARAGLVAPVVIARTYETQAGYIVLDDAPGSTLADTLTYLPYK